MGIKDSLLEKMEIGRDGKLSINDVVTLVLQCKGSAVPREAFLREMLEGSYSQDVIDKAIAETPVAAGISIDELRALSVRVINESLTEADIKQAIEDAKKELQNDGNTLQKASGALTELSQNRFLREIIRTTQKIQYLFGFPEVSMSEKGTIQGPKSRMTVAASFAVMLGLDNADDLMKAVAASLPYLNEDTAKIMDGGGQVYEVIKDCRKKFLGLISSVSILGANPLVKKVIQKTGFMSKYQEYSMRLVDSLTDTKLTNENHEPSPIELEYIKELS